MNDFQQVTVYGAGVIGMPLIQRLSTIYSVVVMDPKYPTKKTDYGKKFVSNIDDPITDSICAFICVPAPTAEDGTVDISIIRSVCDSIISEMDRADKIFMPVCIRNTLTPDLYATLCKEYPRLGIVHWPEFLREQHAEEDFNNMTTAFLGARNTVETYVVSEIIQSMFPSQVSIFIGDITTVSLAKYAINTYLATKVTFFNELKELYDAVGGADYENLRQLVISDPRIGESHTQVPGPDGKMGWGGMCLQKDAKAFATYARNAGVELSLIEAARKKNEFHRSMIVDAASPEANDD